MTAFRLWLQWISHGRAQLAAMRADYEQRISKLERRVQDIPTITVTPPDVRESPQRQKPEVLQARTWHEFLQQVEPEETIDAQ